MGNLESAIDIRYTGKSCCSTSLSCGGAFELADLRPGEILIDIGSGRGADVLRAARVSEAIQYGVDPVESMLRVSSDSALAIGIENVKFLKGWAHSLPLDSNFADVVISNCVINHAPDKAAVYSEIHRILKNGGRFVVSDVLAENVIPDAIKNDPEAVAACYGGAETKANYFGAIRIAGFREIEILEESAPYLKGGVEVRSITVRGYKIQS